jgi:Tfp pilus assembly protein PilV
VPNGYTLVETVVAIFVFSIGGLALAGTSAVIGKELNANTVRERAARVAANRIELLVAACEVSADGDENVAGMQSSWIVSHPAPNSIAVVETVSYVTPRGPRTDQYTARMRC